MSGEIANAYTEMIRQINDGKIAALIPARDDDGAPMLWMTAVDFSGVDLRDPSMGVVLAVAAIKYAYRAAREDHVDTLI